MSFSWAFQRYHFHLDPIWPDGTFNQSIGFLKNRTHSSVTERIATDKIINILIKYAFVISIYTEERARHKHILIRFKFSFYLFEKIKENRAEIPYCGGRIVGTGIPAVGLFRAIASMHIRVFFDTLYCS